MAFELKIHKAGGCAALLAVLVLSSCQGESKPVHRQDPRVKVVKAAYVDHQQQIALTGVVVADVQTDLSFRVSGQITEWDVDVGSKVKAGDILARIDPEEQEADLRSAEAAVSAAEAQARQAQSAFDRQKLLLSKGSTTQETFDQAQTAISTAKGSLDVAKANSGTARDALSYTVLRADTDGIVTERNAEVGQVVQAAQKIFSVARDGPRDATFDIYESLLFSKPPENKINLALVSDPSVRTQGEVSEISPTINSDTGTVRVKIAMDSTPERMTLGAPVTGFASSAPVKLVVLPWTALSSLGEKPAVWVLDPEKNTVALRAVTINSYETGRILISDGVKPEEMLVVEGSKMLRPGQTVVPQEEQAK